MATNPEHKPVPEFDETAQAAVMDALIEFTATGLAANAFVVASIKRFKEQMNIPKAVRIPKIGTSRTQHFAGIPILEVTEGDGAPAHHCVVILASSVRSDELSLATDGLIIPG